MRSVGDETQSGEYESGLEGEAGPLNAPSFLTARQGSILLSHARPRATRQCSSCLNLQARPRDVRGDQRCPTMNLVI